jgi:hypothetical protein
MAENALIALAEEIGSSLAAETQQRKIEIADLRVEVAQLRVEIANMQEAPYAEVLAALAKIEALLPATVGQEPPARPVKMTPTVN